MVYLKSFRLLNMLEEHNLICNSKRIYNSSYPCHIFPEKEFENISFEPVTIFYGDNGSGKTTLLNIIANKIRASRRNINDLGSRFDDYVQGCDCELNERDCSEIKLILSDDVFDFLLDQRAINSDVNRRKDQLVDEYKILRDKTMGIEVVNRGDYELLRNKVDANRQTVSKYVRSHLGKNTIVQQSNGQQALDFWYSEIRENAIYLIDEPENSLSATNQLALRQYIEEAARFYNCQFIISTHSPFILSITDGRIYDLDSFPVKTKKWYELENMKVYHQFFDDNSEYFR